MPSVSHLAYAWLQDDGHLQRTIAQLALNLVYKLLKGQMDESDGLDAPYNHQAIEAHRAAVTLPAWPFLQVLVLLV